MAEERAHLPNWTGLLSWSTKYHDGTSASQFGPMDQDRRLWLEKALNAAFEGGEDPNQIMKKAVTEIQEGRISVGLDMLDHVSDFPDCAENIEILGALKELVDLLKHDDRNVVKRTCEILTLYLPNNPKIQLAAALKHNCMSTIKSCILKHTDDSEVMTLGLSVLGNLIRNVAPLENGFLRESGVRFTVSACRTSFSPGSVQKVCSLLLSLAQRHDLTNERGEVEGLIHLAYTSDIIERDNIQVFETLAALVARVGAADSVRDAIRQRLKWLDSLEETPRLNFSAELEILQEFRMQ